MLKRFVAPEDYPTLLEIIEKVRTDTLEGISVLVIYGEDATGKETFFNILSVLSGCPCKRFRRVSDIEFQEHVVLAPISYFYSDRGVQFYHDKINGKFVCNDMTGMRLDPDLVMRHQTIERPGTLIVGTGMKPYIEVNVEDKRKPMYLHFPNRFDYCTVIKCLNEINSRNTIILLGVLRRLGVCSKDMRTVVGRIFYIKEKAKYKRR